MADAQPIGDLADPHRRTLDGEHLPHGNRAPCPCTGQRILGRRQVVGEALDQGMRELRPAVGSRGQVVEPLFAQIVSDTRQLADTARMNPKRRG